MTEELDALASVLGHPDGLVLEVEHEEPTGHIAGTAESVEQMVEKTLETRAKALAVENGIEIPVEKHVEEVPEVRIVTRTSGTRTSRWVLFPSPYLASTSLTAAVSILGVGLLPGEHPDPAFRGSGARHLGQLLDTETILGGLRIARDGRRGAAAVPAPDDVSFVLLARLPPCKSRRDHLLKRRQCRTVRLRIVPVLCRPPVPNGADAWRPGWRPHGCQGIARTAFTPAILLGQVAALASASGCSQCEMVHWRVLMPGDFDTTDTTQ